MGSSNLLLKSRMHVLVFDEVGSAMFAIKCRAKAVYGASNRG